MTNKCGQTRQWTNTDFGDELCHIGVSGVVASLLRLVTKRGVSLRQQNDISVINIFNEKRKSCNHQYPDSVYFHMLLIIYIDDICFVR